MELIPIKENSEAPVAHCQEVHAQTLRYYDKVGCAEPWISYYLKDNDEIVGTCAFKGRPNGQNKVEIAYYTFEPFQGKGYGTKMCAKLIDIAAAQSDVFVFARTMPEPNASTTILNKNGFKCIGSVIDPEDGEVWEWHLQGLGRHDKIII